MLTLDCVSSSYTNLLTRSIREVNKSKDPSVMIIIWLRQVDSVVPAFGTEAILFVSATETILEVTSGFLKG